MFFIETARLHLSFSLGNWRGYLDSPGLRSLHAKHKFLWPRKGGHGQHILTTFVSVFREKWNTVLQSKVEIIFSPFPSEDYIFFHSRDMPKRIPHSPVRFNVVPFAILYPFSAILLYLLSSLLSSPIFLFSLVPSHVVSSKWLASSPPPRKGGGGWYFSIFIYSPNQKLEGSVSWYRITRATLFELNYQNWGRWACILCRDSKYARSDTVPFLIYITSNWSASCQTQKITVLYFCPKTISSSPRCIFSSAFHPLFSPLL